MLGRLFGRGEERTVTYQSVWGAGLDWFGGGQTWAGVAVSQETAMQSASVYACVRLLCDTVATLPVDTFVRRNGDRVPFRPRPEWVYEPTGPGSSRIEYMQQVVASMLVSHGAVIQVVRGGNGDVVALIPLNPLRVEPRRNPRTRDVEYVVDGSVVLSAADVLYIPEFVKPGAVKGSSRVDEVRQVLGLDRALTEFAARFFGNGTTLSGVLQVPGNITREQAKELVEGWEAKYSGSGKSHRPGILSGGAEWKPVSIDPEKAQALQSRQSSDEAVARIFKVPPSMIGITTPGASSYNSVEQQAIAFVRYSLLPLVTRIEEAHSRLLPGGAFVRFNVDALLRGDSATQASVYSTALQAGFMSINDVRRLNDMPPVPGGDSPRVPLANVDLTAAGLAEMQAKAAVAVQLIQVGFDPSATLSALGLPSIDHTGVLSNQLQQEDGTGPDMAGDPTEDSDDQSS